MERFLTSIIYHAFCFMFQERYAIFVLLLQYADGTIKSFAILTQVGDQHIWGEESKKSLRCWSTVVAEDKCLSLGKRFLLLTVNFLNIRTPKKIGCNHSKIWTMWLYNRVMSPNDADGMANSEDPDQTASLGAVWSGSALFAQAYLSENLGSLQYSKL